MDMSDGTRESLVAVFEAHEALIGSLISENAKLRELCAGMMKALRRAEGLAGMDALVGYTAWYAPKLHDLGIEVD
jgi:hypothetical protein